MTETMPGVSFLLPLQFDVAATFLAAIAATWAASRRGYDLIGVCMLAFVGSVGGGLLRDSVFIMQIPVVMQHRDYLWAILLGVAIGVVTFRYAERFVHLFDYTDALSLGVYGVYGANRALIAGLSAEGAIIVGLCNAVGGGLIRDVLVAEVPLLFKPGQLYALAALAGIVTFVVVSYSYGMDTYRAAWLSICITALLRLLAIRFNLATRSVKSRLGLS
ncbi:MAG: TRIC cation channel family protein [Betaproteobacteria bacterium]|nr:TRIC cation channel family protein [Betaproteobacteria bacterium]